MPDLLSQWLQPLLPPLRWVVLKLDQHHDGFGVLALVVGGFWALLVFQRDKRAKASELLLKLEEEHSHHLKTFLGLEYLVSYQEHYALALRKMLTVGGGDLSDEESKAIDRLERALRYLAFCAHIEGLGIDSGLLGQLHSYNLNVIIAASQPELRAYVEKYWPSVWRWAHLAGRSTPSRLVRRFRLSVGPQIPPPNGPHGDPGGRRRPRTPAPKAAQPPGSTTGMEKA